MKVKIKISILYSLLFVAGNSYRYMNAQNVMIDENAVVQYCQNFHRAYCTSSGKKSLYRYNGQSRSALFENGQKSEFQIVVYKGNDYRISLCNDQSLGNLRMRIISEKRIPETKEVVEKVQNSEGNLEEVPVEKTVYRKEQTVLYDNAQDNYAREITFSIETSQKLIIEITAGAEGESASSRGGKSGVSSGEMGCVGVLIEHMTTPKKGF